MKFHATRRIAGSLVKLLGVGSVGWGTVIALMTLYGPIGAAPGNVPSPEIVPSGQCLSITVGPDGVDRVLRDGVEVLDPAEKACLIAGAAPVIRAASYAIDRAQGAADFRPAPGTSSVTCCASGDCCPRCGQS